MTYIPVQKRSDNRKVVGEFYPLHKEEPLALRKAKLHNNAAKVHLALRYENPFCVRQKAAVLEHRPIEIVPKEFALRWFIPENSVYEMYPVNWQFCARHFGLEVVA